MDDFEAADVETGETRIFVRRSGSGSPLLLLHGFPQTHLMWRDVAPLLAKEFTVICADLRGYGLSGCPPSTPDHAPYAKRAMARDMIVVMERLGFRRFSVAGHDRGGRVAYRMASVRPRWGDLRHPCPMHAKWPVVRQRRLLLVVSLWIREGLVADFEAYERKASLIMKRYGGIVERVVRISEPGTASDHPFEVHLVSFPSRAMFETYRTDAKLKALSSEREAVIMKSVVLVGNLGPAYAT